LERTVSGVHDTVSIGAIGLGVSATRTDTPAVVVDARDVFAFNPRPGLSGAT
jgi:hypothetical protein